MTGVAYSIDPQLPAVALNDITCVCGQHPLTARSIACWPRPRHGTNNRDTEDTFWTLVYRAQRTAAGLPPPELSRPGFAS